MKAEFANVPAIVPSLDPDEKLHAVVNGLLDAGFTDIVLVNDGSHPENLHFFTDEAEAHPEITLLTHEVNRGKGAAMKTAFAYLLENRPTMQGVVTVDGDNQHRPEDTARCVEQMLASGHTVLGVRDFSLPNVPRRSKVGNRITCAVFRLLVGMKISDTQTGLRAMPTDALKILAAVSGDRYEYETNTLLAMQEYSLPFDEVKIETVYIEENKSSHFNTVKDSFRIYKLLLGHFVKFIASSALCSLFELLLYAIFSMLLQNALTGALLTGICTVISRVLSSLLNFFFNKKLVFGNKENTGKTMLRYYALAIPQMIVQGLLTEGSYRLFSITESQTFLRTLIYMIVMIVLFIASYTIQKKWVFKKKAPASLSESIKP